MQRVHEVGLKEQMKKIMSYPHGRGERKALIRHLKGHHDHMHVRF